MGNNEIGAALAQEQARRGLTDGALGDLLGVTGTSVTRWRIGHTVPQARHAVRLAAFLGMPLAKVEKMIDRGTRKPPPVPRPKTETFGVLMRSLEGERGLTTVELWQASGIDKSRFYRLRADKATPHLADIPDLARRLAVDEERAVLAAYRTELARTGRDQPPSARQANTRRRHHADA